MVNPRILGKRVIKRQHIDQWAVGNDEIAPGVIHAPHLGGQIIDETHIHPTTLGGLVGSPQLLVMSAVGASIASGGGYVNFDSVVAQTGFGDVVAAGASWVHPVAGVYVLFYEHDWDSYQGGGTIRFELDGALPPGGIIGDAVSGQDGSGSIMYLAEAGQIGKVEVTQSSGSAQTCDAIVYVGISDSRRSTGATWTKVFDADTWGIHFDGTNWWTSEGLSGTTVTKRDTSGAALASFSASTQVGVRGITFDGTYLWVTGGGPLDPGENIAQHQTDGMLVASFVTGPSSDGNRGLAWDGSHLWLVENPDAAGDTDFERWTTAGTLASSFTVVGNITYRGLAIYGGDLYSIDTANDRIDVFQTDGTVVGSIPVGVSGPTGVWIADDGTVYVSKDGDAVYRRDKKVWES